MYRLLLCVLLCSACSDFSTDLRRGSDGAIVESTAYLVPQGEQRIFAPSGELFVRAWTGDGSVADVRINEREGNELIVSTVRAGTTQLNFATDFSSEPESIELDVRVPDLVELDVEGDWIATTDELEIGYDLFGGGERLEGAGYKAFVSAPGLSVREIPLELEQVGWRNGWHRNVRILAGGEGTFRLTLVDGNDVTFQRVEPAKVQDMRVAFNVEGSREVGDVVALHASGYVDGQIVMNLNRFRIRSKSRSVCRVDDTDARRDGLTAWIEMRSSGTCVIEAKSRDRDWRREVSLPVR